MDELFRTGLSNAVAATVLALLAAIVGRVVRRPALTHALWLLVLVKLVTPPLRVVEFEWPSSEPARPIEVTANMPEEPAIGFEPEPEFAAALQNVEIANGDSGFGDPLPPSKDIRSTEAAETPNQPLLPRVAVSSWTSLLAECWLAGSTVWLLLVAFRTHRFQSLLREARSAPVELREVRRLARRLGL